MKLVYLTRLEHQWRGRLPYFDAVMRALSLVETKSPDAVERLFSAAGIGAAVHREMRAGYPPEFLDEADRLTEWLHDLTAQYGERLQIHVIDPPKLWDRDPPVRYRKSVPDTWVEITISEGRNRQVRRMTAHIGFPTLRLVRWRVGSWTLDGIENGHWAEA